MPLPAILDVAREHLFADSDKMEAAGVPAATSRHILRLRDIYNFWLAYPSKRDRDIVAELRRRYGLGDSAARQDLRLIKDLLGEFQKVSKDYMRYRVSVMLSRAYEKADAANNTRDMVAAAKALTEVHQLDKEDPRTDILDKVVPIVLNFTDDPTVIGIKRMPDFRNRIKAVKEQYFLEQTEDVGYEEVDAGLDDLFKPTPGNGNTQAAGLPQ